MSDFKLIEPLSKLADESQKKRSIESKALELLARREHSRRELALKLQKRFDDEALIQQVLDQLISQDWLNEQRFTEAYIRYRASKGFGPLRIRLELSERGISAEAIEQTLSNSITLDWRALAEQARQKKFGRLLPKTYLERMQQLKFLYYRGFEQYAPLDE